MNFVCFRERKTIFSRLTFTYIKAAQTHKYHSTTNVYSTCCQSIFFKLRASSIYTIVVATICQTATHISKKYNIYSRQTILQTSRTYKRGANDKSFSITQLLGGTHINTHTQPFATPTNHSNRNAGSPDPKPKDREYIYTKHTLRTNNAARNAPRTTHATHTQCMQSCKETIVSISVHNSG